MLVPPLGLTTAGQIREHWLSVAAELEQWAESPLEHKQARDYRARIEAATNDELRAQYAPYAMPIAWHHVSDVVARPGSDVDQADDAPPASP